MFRKTAILFLILSSFAGVARGQDSAKAVVKKKEPLHLFSFADPHSARKAGIYAAVIPGLGQVYNRKYWKVPLVYATFGTATYLMLNERKQMRNLNSQFRAAYAINKDTTIDPNLIAQRDNHRRYRDFALLAMTGIYVFQIIDATVDAHFYKLNLDQNLSAKLNPSPSRIFQLTYQF